MRILITGSNGLLGQKLVRLCLERKLNFIATSKGANRNPDCPDHLYLPMDISNKLEINQVFGSFYPTHVIHTAAITNVDYCEDHAEECRLVNIESVKQLFNSCKQFEAHFQLLSTDFVFDGQQGNYKETDPVNPLSIYAKSKVEAEEILLQDAYANWSVVRTIIVYGEGNNLSRSNIVLWAIDSLKQGKKMEIVDDQFRMPTWADDLAWACMEIVHRQKTGIFHISGPVLYSVYDLVLAIGRHYGWNTDVVVPVKSETLNQTAKRPPKTGFDLQKAQLELNYRPHTLQETLEFLK